MAHPAKTANCSGATAAKPLKPLILAVETSGRIGSVALATGSQILAETAFSAPMRHSTELFGAVRGLLERFGKRAGEIEQVYVSVGPGSFTGLRIAVTMAKTMHLGNSAVKIVAVATLDVIAANAICQIENGSVAAIAAVDRIAAILDAKRGQFFVAVYEKTRPGPACEKPGPDSAAWLGWAGGRWRKVLADSLLSASQFVEAFANPSVPVRLLGEGLVYYRDKFEGPGVDFFDEGLWTPRAEKVHFLGRQMAVEKRFRDPVGLTPRYLREADARVKS